MQVVECLIPAAKFPRNRPLLTRIGSHSPPIFPTFEDRPSAGRKGNEMKQLAIVAGLTLTTAIGAALTAQKASASDPLPLPRPAASEISFDDPAAGLAERTVYVSALDPEAAATPGYGVNDSERVVFPVYFPAGWTMPSDEAETMLRAVAEEITYRGLRDIRVSASETALTTPELAVERDTVARVEAVAASLEKFGVPEKWIAMQPNAGSDV